jgi:hypothetical protein
MTLPGQTFTIIDPGMGTVQPLTNVPLVMGITSSGTSATLTSVNSIATLVSTFGYGPAVDIAAAILERAGGPIWFCKVAESSGGDVSAIVKVGSHTDPDITDNSSAPYNDYECVLNILSDGALGVARYEYSLDGGRTFSPSLLTPSGGALTIPNTGIVLTMAAGTYGYHAGNSYTFTTSSPDYTSTQLALCKTAIDAAGAGCQFDWVVLAGKHATASAANTIAGVLAGYLDSWETKFRFVRAMMDAGSTDTAANVASTVTTEDQRLMAVYGTADTAISNPQTGRSQPSVPALLHTAVRAASRPISEHLGRVATGSLAGVAGYSTEFGAGISHDEATAATPLDDSKFATLRTFQQLTGYYITRANLRCPVGSDFRRWELGRVFDAGLKVVYQQQQAAVNRTFRTNADGTIYEADAAAFEAMVNAALKQTLLQPTNSEGTKGHVSAVSYTVDRTEVINLTNTLRAQLAIRPLGYSEYIATTASMQLQVA